MVCDFIVFVFSVFIITYKVFDDIKHDSEWKDSRDYVKSIEMMKYYKF